MSDEIKPTKTYFVVSHEMERPHISTMHVVKTNDFEELRRQLNSSAWSYYNVFVAESRQDVYPTTFGGTELKRVMFIQPTMWMRTLILQLVHEMRLKGTTPEQWEAMMEFVVDVFSTAAQGNAATPDGTVIIKKPFGVG